MQQELERPNPTNRATALASNGRVAERPFAVVAALLRSARRSFPEGIRGFTPARRCAMAGGEMLLHRFGLFDNLDKACRIGRFDELLAYAVLTQEPSEVAHHA